VAVDEFLEVRFGAKVEWVGGVLTWVGGEVEWAGGVKWSWRGATCVALRRDEVAADVVEKGVGYTPRNTPPARAGQSWSLGGAGGWGWGGGQRGGASLTPLRPPHLCPFIT
jgi:hypothetical protein